MSEPHATTMSDFLSLDQILAMQDIKTEVVEIPEWALPDGTPGKLRVRGMTGRERDEFEASTLERRGKRMVPNINNIRAKLVSWCVVDEHGRRMFTAQHVVVLGEKNAAAISRLYDVAALLSGITEEDIEDLAAPFEETKELPSGSDSSTASPNDST